jgi:hypothetical protein
VAQASIGNLAKSAEALLYERDVSQLHMSPQVLFRESYVVADISGSPVVLHVPEVATIRVTFLPSSIVLLGGVKGDASYYHC